MSNSQNSPVSRTPSPAFSPLHVKEKKAVVQVPQAPLGQANRESEPCLVEHWIFREGERADLTPSLALLRSPANPIIPGQQVDPAHDHTSVGGGVYEKGLGQKALLAKRFAKASKSTVSPTDSMQSPCSAKLTSAKKRHFQKWVPRS